MTSNLRRTLQAALAVVVVVWSAAAGAQENSPEAAPAKTAPPPAEPGSVQNFAAPGEWLLSVENLFGYTYAHQSNNVSANTFTLFSDPQGIAKSAYNWPRLAIDTMVSSAISLGVAASFARFSASGASNTAYEGAVRVGYALLPGPSLGIWPRVGVTYAHQTANSQSAAAVTVDALLVAVATPHLLLTLGPVADIGIWGKGQDLAHREVSVTYLNIGVYFGLTVPF